MIRGSGSADLAVASPPERWTRRPVALSLSTEPSFPDAIAIDEDDSPTSKINRAPPP